MHGGLCAKGKEGGFGQSSEIVQVLLLLTNCRNPNQLVVIELCRKRTGMLLSLSGVLSPSPECLCALLPS